MTRNISKSHLAKVFSRVGESKLFFGERSGERLNMYFCMNVHLLSEQLVAVTQYDYHYDYYDDYYYYYYSCSCFGGWICHKTLPRKRRKFGESSAQDWRKFTLPHLTPSPL